MMRSRASSAVTTVRYLKRASQKQCATPQTRAVVRWWQQRDGPDVRRIAILIAAFRDGRQRGLRVRSISGILSAV
jgi:hypothetical protein